jgi:hypothetical protein
MPFDIGGLFAGIEPLFDALFGFIQEILTRLFGTTSPFA